MKPEIQHLHERKAHLERRLRDAVEQFERDTGCSVDAIDIERITRYRTGETVDTTPIVRADVRL